MNTCTKKKQPKDKFNFFDQKTILYQQQTALTQFSQLCKFLIHAASFVGSFGSSL